MSDNGATDTVTLTIDGIVYVVDPGFGARPTSTATATTPTPTPAHTSPCIAGRGPKNLTP